MKEHSTGPSSICFVVRNLVVASFLRALDMTLFQTVENSDCISPAQEVLFLVPVKNSITYPRNTSPFFINHILTPKRYQNFSP